MCGVVCAKGFVGSECASDARANVGTKRCSSSSPETHKSLSAY